MQLEQLAELNRYVDRTIPLTWEVRWRTLKPVLPILVFTSALLVEQAALRLWLNDRSVLSGLPLLAVCLLSPIVLVMGVAEVATRVTHRSKRTIQLEPERVSISPAKYNRIPWKQLKACQLEPIPGAAGLSKLTLSYSLGKGTKRAREWSMVLRQADQEHQFISELEHLRQRGVSSGQLVRLPAPTEIQRKSVRVRGMVAAALGLYFILHGLPLLGVGLLPPDRSPDESRSHSRFTAKETAKLRRVVRQAFSSPEQVHRFLLVVGGGLTALGAGLYFWGLSTPKRDEPEPVIGSHGGVEGA